MFETLRPQPPDGLLALIGLFRDDPRPRKIDLGVGTYRDETGTTPVMAAVKAAERRLLEGQTSKGYLGPEGDLRFVRLLAPIAFGAALADEMADGRRMVGAQTPGGGGALRLGAALIAAARPGARVWLGAPSWPNHRPIFAAAGLDVIDYRHFDPATQSLCFDDTLAALRRAEPGDVALLHGCCHNPTGADFDPAQWRTVAELVAERRLVPFVDLAYQGLGRGLDADAQGVRQVLALAEEALVAYSCDKNFGLYRERTGALFASARDAGAAATVYGNMLAHARVNWSMPPDHGAAAVRCVLESPELTDAWHTELEGMCARIAAVRRAVAGISPSLGFLERQRGMFSQLRVAPDMVEALRRQHAIYMAGSGRINLAGLQAADAGVFVAALTAVGAMPSRTPAALEPV